MNYKEILLQAKNIAVVGVTPNKEKYGYKIYQKLKETKATIWGVSPLYSQIEQDLIYPDLISIPSTIDLVVMVVSPEKGISYINQCQEKAIPLIWLQPHTYDEALLEAIHQANIQSIQACVLVELSA